MNQNAQISNTLAKLLFAIKYLSPISARVTCEELEEKKDHQSWSGGLTNF